MGAEPQPSLCPTTPFEQLRRGREILVTEGEAVVRLGRQLPSSFVEAVALVADCPGCVLVSGMGKAGLIGQKIVATLGSLGFRSHFLHPAEAMHGDLGRVGNQDVVLLLSHSGETEEIVRLLGPLNERNVALVGITASADSSLGRACRVVLPLGRLTEACALGVAPTTSTTAMLALGDALALVASELCGFTRGEFARFHPGGSLGRRLGVVDDHMRPLAECRVARPDASVREALVATSRPGRRTGAVLLVDDSDRLCGLFTDSDLARLLETRRDDALDRPIAEVMTAQPRTVASGARILDAVAILAGKKISELPVLDPTGRVLGLLDITDLVDG